MKEILNSKKGFMALVAIAALTIVTAISIITKANFIDQTMFWATLSSIVGPYLISQGIADYGNGKAKTEANEEEIRLLKAEAEVLSKD